MTRFKVAKQTSVYINMTREIAVTGLKLKYQNSVLGYFWSLAKPLLLFMVYYFAFTKVFKIGGKIPNYPVYLLLGIVLWSFFTEVTSVAMGAIVSKGGLIKKVYFPRIVLVIAVSLTSFFTFLLNMVVIFGFIGFQHITITPMSLLFIPLVIEYYIFALGAALILSSLYVRFRDIAHIWQVIIQALFYATPILYALTFIPEQYRWIVSMSPLAQILQDSRFVLISNETVVVRDVLSFPLILVPYLLPFVIFIVGYFLFNKMSAKFAEEI